MYVVNARHGEACSMMHVWYATDNNQLTIRL